MPRGAIVPVRTWRGNAMSRSFSRATAPWQDARMTRMTIAKKLTLATIVTASLLLGTRADAAPPFVERRLTLPTHDWAFDLGLGIGHYDFGNNVTGTGAGLNFEGA